MAKACLLPGNNGAFLVLFFVSWMFSITIYATYASRALMDLGIPFLFPWVYGRKLH